MANILERRDIGREIRALQQQIGVRQERIPRKIGEQFAARGIRGGFVAREQREALQTALGPLQERLHELRRTQRQYGAREQLISQDLTQQFQEMGIGDRISATDIATLAGVQSGRLYPEAALSIQARIRELGEQRYISGITPPGGRGVREAATAPGQPLGVLQVRGGAEGEGGRMLELRIPGDTRVRSFRDIDELSSFLADKPELARGLVVSGAGEFSPRQEQIEDLRRRFGVALPRVLPKQAQTLFRRAGMPFRFFPGPTTERGRRIVASAEPSFEEGIKVVREGGEVSQNLQARYNRAAMSQWRSQAASGSTDAMLRYSIAREESGKGKLTKFVQQQIRRGKLNL